MRKTLYPVCIRFREDPSIVLLSGRFNLLHLASNYNKESSQSRLLVDNAEDGRGRIEYREIANKYLIHHDKRKNQSQRHPAPSVATDCLYDSQ